MSSSNVERHGAVIMSRYIFVTARTSHARAATAAGTAVRVAARAAAARAVAAAARVAVTMVMAAAARGR
eukprot:scaffold95546_cov60-Phaeocystis_antarctica.AAC.2